MALLRNLTRDDCRSSISRLYGSNKWLDIKDNWQKGILKPDEVRLQLVSLFIDSLKKLGYRYVSDITPAPFSKPPFYYIIWAKILPTAKRQHGGFGILGFQALIQDPWNVGTATDPAPASVVQIWLKTRWWNYVNYTSLSLQFSGNAPIKAVQ